MKKQAKNQTRARAPYTTDSTERPEDALRIRREHILAAVDCHGYDPVRIREYLEKRNVA